MIINIYPDIDLLLKAFAEYFITSANKYISENGKFNVVFSGGKSPEKFYQLLTKEPYNKLTDWNNIYVFFADERCVPLDDPENNGRMVKKSLFDPLNIKEKNIFRINTSLNPTKAALDYNNCITDHFKASTITFDLVMLGLGDNAHTASLFPYNELLNVTEAKVMNAYLQQENSNRITMTAPMINHAKQIAFLVYGKSKAEAVKNVLSDRKDYKQYPAQLIYPENGELQWFLDEEASLLINN